MEGKGAGPNPPFFLISASNSIILDCNFCISRSGFACKLFPPKLHGASPQSSKAIPFIASTTGINLGEATNPFGSISCCRSSPALRPNDDATRRFFCRMLNEQPCMAGLRSAGSTDSICLEIDEKFRSEQICSASFHKCPS